MSALAEAEKLLPSLTQSEKAQLLQWVISDIGDAYPGIESNIGVMGGDPCITRTRIPVWLLEQARRQGLTESAILQIYPALRAADIAYAWSYVRSHRDEIEQQIQVNEGV